MSLNITQPVDLQGASGVVARSLTPRKPVAAAAQATSISPRATKAAADGNQITSNDFLTLLVTEMKNQDPTQPTDPNAYIQQLVGVNSLQQLISINGELGAGGSATTGADAGVDGVDR